MILIALTLASWAASTGLEQATVTKAGPPIEASAPPPPVRCAGGTYTLDGSTRSRHPCTFTAVDAGEFSGCWARAPFVAQGERPPPWLPPGTAAASSRLDASACPTLAASPLLPIPPTTSCANGISIDTDWQDAVFIPATCAGTRFRAARLPSLLGAGATLTLVGGSHTRSLWAQAACAAEATASQSGLTVTTHIAVRSAPSVTWGRAVGRTTTLAYADLRQPIPFSLLRPLPRPSSTPLAQRYNWTDPHPSLTTLFTDATAADVIVLAVAETLTPATLRAAGALRDTDDESLAASLALTALADRAVRAIVETAARVHFPGLLLLRGPVGCAADEGRAGEATRITATIVSRVRQAKAVLGPAAPRLGVLPAAAALADSLPRSLSPSLAIYPHIVEQTLDGNRSTIGLACSAWCSLGRYAPIGVILDMMQSAIEADRQKAS